ncbi:MAG: hypothetical protein ACTSYH_03460 [Candidatus Heimdallarchaeaceae archaeon]
MPKLNKIKASLDVNLSVRREFLEGKEHLVVPVVMLVEGVHNGLFYSAEELSKFPESWNGRPAPVLHPYTENGEPISANYPSIVESQKVGVLYNTHFDWEGKKLKSEVWIDLQKAEKVDKSILDHIYANKNLEVSTGLWTEKDGISGIWNGEKYTSSVFNFRPDHLALLPGLTGACSWKDGCGIRANENKKEGKENKSVKLDKNIRTKARTPKYDGTETVSWAGVSKTFESYRDAYYEHTKVEKPDDVPSDVSDAPSEMKSWIASKTLLGDAQSDMAEDLIFFPVVNPKTNKLNEGALRAVISGRGAQADISEEVKKSAQDKARSLLNKEFDAELKTQSLFGKLLGHLTGFRIQEMSHQDIHSQIRSVMSTWNGNDEWNYLIDVYDDFFVYEVEGKEGSKLFKRSYELEDGVVRILDDSQAVIEKRTYEVVSNNVLVDKEINENKNTEKLIKEKIEINKNVEEVDSKMNVTICDLIANEKTQFIENDREWLSKLSAEQLEKLVPVEANEETAEEETKEEPEVNSEDEIKDSPQSAEEYVSNAPAEIQDILNSALKMHAKKKEDLVAGILANKRNKFTKDALKAKGMEELEALAELAHVEIDYSARRPAVIEENSSNEEEPMGVVTLNDLSERFKAQNS